MTKTKAEQVKDLTVKAQNIRQKERVHFHEKYAEKIVSKKVVEQARKGRKSFAFKPKRKYSLVLLIEAFREMGFNTTDKRMKNGRYELTIKW